jgi:FKBP-type peptidyl-prolyl cis-trans isomerase (trigger factor)
MNTSLTTQTELLPNSQVKITVTIPTVVIESFRKESMKRFQNTLSVDGFRPGHIPESTIVERVGDMGIWADMAELAFTEHYPTIITDSKQSPIGQPAVTLSKIAINTDAEYIITTDVMPTITLGDIEKIAKEKNKTEIEAIVTDIDVENAIKEIRQMRAHQQMHDDGIDHHDHNHQNIPDGQLPEMTDEYVKTLGAFTDVADFKKQLRENMAKEKLTTAHEKRRIEIIEAIIADATIDIPESLVAFELNKMLEQFKYDLTMQGMNIDAYLGHTGTDIDGLKKEWHDQALKRVQMQLVLETLAEKFSIKPDQISIDNQVDQIMETYKDQPIERANVVAYVTQVVTNGAVFDWLEAQK